MKKLVYFFGALLLVSLCYNLYFIHKKVYIAQIPEFERYRNLSPRIFSEGQNDILINFVELRSNMRAYVREASTSAQLGVYFEYLPSGVSIGVNETEQYVLASLLKVPLVMQTYKLKEEGQLRMDEELVISSEHLDPLFGDLWKEGAGKKITVKEAIDLVLKESDNTAKNVLFNRLPPGSIEKVFDALDIPKVLDQDMAVVTPKNYSSILRSLYLSSYLTFDDSEEILEIMSNSEFTDKLRAGVPPEVKVAHKIGVYSPETDKSIYTDCGIVYVPRRPYILCLMARATNTDAQTWFSQLSSMVYTYVKNY